MGAASAALPECTAWGTEGDDQWEGSESGPTDVVCGLGGHDYIYGVCTGTFLGGPEGDWVEENAGTFYGGDDGDGVGRNMGVGVFHGGPGWDWVYQNRGTFHGHAGSDLVTHDHGVFRGGVGPDRLHRNWASGTFHGEAGRDRVWLNVGAFRGGGGVDTTRPVPASRWRTMRNGIELEQVTSGPMGLGTVVRRRTSRGQGPVEGSVRFVEWKPDHVMAAVIHDGPLEMRSRMVIEPAGARSSTVTIFLDIPSMTEPIGPAPFERSLANIEGLIESET